MDSRAFGNADLDPWSIFDHRMAIQTGKRNLPEEVQADATAVVAVDFQLNPRTNNLRDDSIPLMIAVLNSDVSTKASRQGVSNFQLYGSPEIPVSPAQFRHFIQYAVSDPVRHSMFSQPSCWKKRIPSYG